jgi:hypothetical protein
VYIFGQPGIEDGNSTVMAFLRPAYYGLLYGPIESDIPRGCALNFFVRRYRPLSANHGLGVACVFLLALISAATATAQTLKTSGTLEGTISDSSGGRIPGVKVNLRQTDTNQTRVVYTDDQGFFRSTDLPVGTYEVRIENPGFAPYLHTGV